MTKKPKRGRPEKKDKPSEKLTVVLHPDLKARIMALKAMKSRLLHEIIEEALDAYVAKLPSGERKMLEELAAKIEREYLAQQAD